MGEYAGQASISGAEELDRKVFKALSMEFNCRVFGDPHADAPSFGGAAQSQPPPPVLAPPPSNHGAFAPPSSIHGVLAPPSSFHGVPAPPLLNIGANILCTFGYRFALDELSKSGDTTLGDVQTQQHVFCFMRYMNAVLETICNGHCIDANSKFFLANLGYAAGRHLNVIPDIPSTVIQSICE